MLRYFLLTARAAILNSLVAALVAQMVNRADPAWAPISKQAPIVENAKLKIARSANLSRNVVPATKASSYSLVDALKIGFDIKKTKQMRYSNDQLVKLIHYLVNI